MQAYLRASLLFVSAVAFAQTTVSISGTVVDESGALLPGATVGYRNSPTTVRDAAGHTTVIGKIVESSVVTGKDGAFSVSGLPPGVYWLCAEGTLATHIRSCDWGYGGKIDLTTAISATNTKLQVHDGVTVTFQVSDPNNRIKDFPSVPGTAVAGNFRIFLVNGPWLKPALKVTAAGTTHQYSLVVPKTSALRLLLDTKLSVLNQAHASVPPGAPQDTIATSGQPVTYSLTVQ